MNSRRWPVVRALFAAATLGLAMLSATSAASGSTAGAAAPAAHPSATGFGSDWPVYHHDPLGSGVDPANTSLSPATHAWTTTLDGELYGEPLVEGGRVIAATENDTVYGLAADTGAVLWSTHLATPVPSSDLPCGNIGPTVGITSTPVIDPARNEVFVLADESVAGHGASHHLVGLDLFSGVVRSNTVADPPGSYPLYQLQRAALALDGTTVLIGYGGNAGDCESPPAVYHGWLVGIPEDGGSIASTFEVASAGGDSEGAIWMGGAGPEVDGSGNIWLATGNSRFTSSGDAYDDSDGVIELGSNLAPIQSFAPLAWYSDNGADADLGSSSPAMLGAGLVFQAGKSNTGYVLSQASLGGVNGQLATSSSYCGADVDGGHAVSGTTVYMPCGSGIEKTVVTAGSPPTVSNPWKSSTGSSGPPILAGGLVWTIAPGSAQLYGLDPSTGAATQTLALGSEANHFPTPTVADGLLLATSASAVVAFTGPGGAPPPPVSPPAAPHVYVPRVDGHLMEYLPDGAYGHLWNGYDQTTDAGGPPVAGMPGAIEVGGIHHVYTRSAQGHLVEYVGDNAGGRAWNDYDLTAAAGGGSPVGASPAAIVAGPLIHVYVRAASGDLVEYVNDGANGHLWNEYDLTYFAGNGSAIAGATSAVAVGSLVHVYVRAASGDLVEYVNDGANGHLWNAYDLSYFAGHGVPVSSGAAPVVVGGLVHVYVQGSNSHLEEFLNDGVNGHLWNAYDLSVFAGNGANIDDTPGVVVNGAIHVYAPGLGYHLTEYVNDSANGHLWNAYDLTFFAGNGVAVSGAPSGVFDGLVHVYAMGSNGHLEEFVNDGAGGHQWNTYDLSVYAGGGGPVGAGPSATPG
jgi:hypothetical protein